MPPTAFTRVCRLTHRVLGQIHARGSRRATSSLTGRVWHQAYRSAARGAVTVPPLTSRGKVLSTQVTATLPDEVYERAERLAQLSHREVADILAETLAVSLPVLRPQLDLPGSVENLGDAEVLTLTDLQLPAAQDRHLSTLLDRQQAGTITETGRAELAALFQLYQEGLLRKAQALAEAVRRGLREPLGP